MTSRSCEMGVPLTAIRSFTFFYLSYGDHRDRGDSHAFTPAYCQYSFIDPIVNFLCHRDSGYVGACFCLCMCVCVFVCFSMTIHPDGVTIATGQVAGHEKHEGKVGNELQ